MEQLQIIGAIIGLCAYIPLFIDVQNGKEQSFATWLLWSILDALVVASLIYQHGNYKLSLGYMTGAIAITILLIYQRKVSWTWFETMIAILAIICMAVWWYSGPKAGTVASSLALAIASIPLQIAVLKNPKDAPILPYILFLVANIVSFLGGKSWTIEERFFPGSAIIVTLLVLLLAMRKPKTVKAGV